LGSAFEKHGIELGFEFLHGDAECRLRNIAHGRGATKMPLCGERHDVAKL
jgi:hypothetical protein